MSDVLAGALSLLLSTNKGTALTNLVAEQTGVIASVAATNDPVALEFQGLLRADDEVSEEVQRWLDALPNGAAVSPELKARIDSRHDGMTRRYEDFLRRHPRHAPAMVAFGSYLGDIGDEIGMAEQWEKAREINPSDPAVWNNLAGHYAHRGQPFLQGRAVRHDVDAVGQAADDEWLVRRDAFEQTLGLLAAVVGGLAGAHQGQRFGRVQVGWALVVE